MTTGHVRPELTCDDVRELAGVYVLGALDDDEIRLLRAHVSDCPDSHAEIAALGGVVPALASLVEPVPGPAGLKTRVMAAIAAEAAVGTAEPDAAATTRPALVGPARVGTARPESPSRRFELERPNLSRWLSWGAVAAALLLIAALGASTVILQSRADRAEERVALLADAIGVMTQPGAAVATLQGTGPAAGATGFAAFPPTGDGYVVLVGLPPAPSGQTYQAWYLVDGRASSAGLLTIESDGYGILSGVARMPGVDQIALTIERGNGSDQPTGAPIMSGQVEA
jgi:hypothetical protein